MKKNVIRLLFALMAILTTTSMLAENKIWVEQYGVTDDGYKFAVMMENDPQVASLQFDLNVPEQLKVVGNRIDANQERLNVSQQFKYRNKGNNNFFCAVFAMRNDSFIGTTGPLAFFTVKGKDSSIDFSKPLGIVLDNIIFSSYDGEKQPGESKWEGEVAINATINVYSSFTEKIVNPATSFALPIEFNNSENVQGLQMDVKLPEGFTLNETNFEYSNRVSDNGRISVTKAADANIYRLMLIDAGGAYVIRNTGEGLIFTCEVNVPETIEADAADMKIEISDVIASDGSRVYPGSGATITLINGDDALSAANAVIEGLKTKLTEALATIAETCPDVKDNFTGEAEQTMIDNLQAAVDQAYADMTLTENYETVMAPAKDIETAIEKLVTDAQEAQAAEVKRQADNKAAYDADVAAIAELQKQLDEAVTVIDTEYADYKDAEAIAAAQALITAATTDSQAAFDAVAKEGVYAYQLDKAGIAEAIEGLVLAAEAAKDKALQEAEANRKAENKAAYEKDMEGLDALYAHYREVVAEIQADYKPYEDVSAELSVRNNLDAVKDAIGKAYKAVEAEGTYSYTLDVEGLTASIDKLLADAKAKKEAADAEALRQAENKAAYDKVMEAIAALQTKFNETVAAIEKDYAGFGDADAEKAVADQISALVAAADAAYAAVEKEGKFEYTFDAAPIETAIDKLLADAKAKKESADAETIRQAENKAAYDKVMEAIDALQTKFNETVATIQKDYAAFEDVEAENAVAAQISALVAAADAAYAAVEKEGKFEYSFDAAPIETAIENLLVEAKAKEAERVASNQEAYDAVKAEIAKVQEEFDEAVAEISKEYPEYNATAEVLAITNALNKAEKEADAAFAAVEKAGEFEYTFDAEAIRAMIATMVLNAKNSGVEAIIADAEAGKIRIFTLDGAQHARPVVGKINVIVRNDGTVSKVMVK